MKEAAAFNTLLVCQSRLIWGFRIMSAKVLWWICFYQVIWRRFVSSLFADLDENLTPSDHAKAQSIFIQKSLNNTERSKLRFYTSSTVWPQSCFVYKHLKRLTFSFNDRLENSRELKNKGQLCKCTQISIIKVNILYLYRYFFKT